MTIILCIYLKLGIHIFHGNYYLKRISVQGVLKERVIFFGGQGRHILGPMPSPLQKQTEARKFAGTSLEDRSKSIDAGEREGGSNQSRHVGVIRGRGSDPHSQLTFNHTYTYLFNGWKLNANLVNMARNCNESNTNKKEYYSQAYL